MGTIFVRRLEFSFLNHNRVANLLDVQLSSSVSASLTLLSPVMFTCHEAIKFNNDMVIGGENLMFGVGGGGGQRGLKIPSPQLRGGPLF